MNNNQFFNQSFGVHGSKVVSDTSATPGNWCAIVALSDTVIAALTGNEMEGFSAVPLPAGVPIYGKISTFTLTSGSVIAYKAQP